MKRKHTKMCCINKLCLHQKKNFWWTNLKVKKKKKLACIQKIIWNVPIMEIASIKLKTKTRILFKSNLAGTLKMVNSVFIMETVACKLENQLKINLIRLFVQKVNKFYRNFKKTFQCMMSKCLRVYRSQLLLMYPKV
jgi:hypothetical protein